MVIEKIVWLTLELNMSGFQVDVRMLFSDWSTNQASIWLVKSVISTEKSFIVYDVI